VVHVPLIPYNISKGRQGALKNKKNTYSLTILGRSVTEV